MAVKSKKELVFVCQVYHPDESSTSQLFKPLMEKFAKAGYSATIICGYAKGKKALREEIAGVVGFTGQIESDTSSPDGAPRKLMDSIRI